VLRGSAARTVEIADSDHIELDGVTIYGGSRQMQLMTIARHILGLGHD